jgi:hypothetical protein
MFGAPGFELQDSALQAEEGRLDLNDDSADADRGDDLEAGGEAPGEEGTPTSRRRRRRRGRRGVMREDAFLGIERLAMEDIAIHKAHEPADEPGAAPHGQDEFEIGDEIGDEITSIEIGGEEIFDRAERDESDAAPKRRRRRRRGRRSKERTADSESADLESDDAALEDEEHEEADEAAEDRPARQRRAGSQNARGRAVRGRDSEAEDGDDTERPNKNLHREVTPWAEAIGYIVSANLESRARSPSGGQRGRWGKGDRRS